MKKLHTDLTQGSVTTRLIRFSMPFLLSNIIQSLYSVADMLIVGWFSGKNGISGVATGGQVTHLIVMLVTGFTVGGTVLVAQYFGAKKHRDVQETIGTLFFLLGVSAVVMTLLFFALAHPILRALQTPAESYSEAYDYLVICLCGNIFIFAYNAVAAILRGLGDSKRPLCFVAIACFINVFLDLLLVGGFKMSAAGAAIATVISQMLSVVLSVAYLRRSDFLFDFRLKSFVPKKDKLGKIFSIGLPSSVQNTIVSFSFMLMTALGNSYGGVAASAAIGIVSKFNGFAIMPAVAMSSSVSAMAGQNLGAGLYDRAKKTMWIAVRISLLVSALVFGLVQLFPEFILRMFSDEGDVIRAGVSYLKLFSFDYLLVSFQFCFNGLIIASGHTTYSLLAGIISAVVIRMPIAYLLCYTFGFGMGGLGAAAPCATLGGITMTAWFVFTGKWKKSKLGIAPAGAWE